MHEHLPTKIGKENKWPKWMFWAIGMGQDELN